MSIMIVALSGFACNGKTTLCNILKKKYNNVHIVKELVRDIYDFDKPLYVNQMNLLAYAIDKHTQDLKFYKRNSDEIFIVDRSIFDYIIFTEMLLNLDLTELVKRLPITEMYDLIVLLTPIYNKIDDCLQERFNVGTTKEDFIERDKQFIDRFLYYVDTLDIGYMVAIKDNTNPLETQIWIENLLFRRID